MVVDLRNLIRNMIEESFVEEADKSRFIDKNRYITDDQKQMLIDHLAKFRHKENMIHQKIGGWNNFYKMKWDDILPIIMYDSKTQTKKKVKTDGIRGLKEGKDYFIIQNVEFDPNYNNPDDLDLVGVYCPLNYEASQLIGSKYIGGREARWCISSNDRMYWYQYSYGIGSRSHYAHEESEFAMFIFSDGTKYALQVASTFSKVWDIDDIDKGDNDVVPGIKTKKFVDTHKKLFSDTRVILDRVDPSEYDHYYDDEYWSRERLEFIDIGDSYRVSLNDTYGDVRAISNIIEYADVSGADYDEDDLEGIVISKNDNDMSVLLEFPIEVDYPLFNNGEMLQYLKSWETEDVLTMVNGTPMYDERALKVGDKVISSDLTPSYSRDVTGVVTKIDRDKIFVLYKPTAYIDVYGLEM
jgi:hypothetical protein